MALQPLPLSERVQNPCCGAVFNGLREATRKSIQDFLVSSDPDYRRPLGSGDVQCIAVRQGW
jgi:hypothetical protein